MAGFQMAGWPDSEAAAPSCSGHPAICNLGIRLRSPSMAKSKRRLLVLINPKDPADPMAGNAPLGTARELVAALAAFNTAPDGSKTARLATAILHGPGMTVEYATAQDPVTQAMVSVYEADTAWPVLSRICRATGWKMQDTESGQVFG